MTDLDFYRSETWTDEDIDRHVADEQQQAARGEGPMRPEDHFPVEWEYDGPGSWPSCFGTISDHGVEAARRDGWMSGTVTTYERDENGERQLGQRELAASDVATRLIREFKGIRSTLSLAIKRIEQPGYNPKNSSRRGSYVSEDQQVEYLAETAAGLEREIVGLARFLNVMLDVAQERRAEAEAESRRLEAERRQTPEWAQRRREGLRNMRDHRRQMIADPNVIMVRP